MSQWFSPATILSLTNRPDYHIAKEIVLKVVLYSHMYYVCLRTGKGNELQFTFTTSFSGVRVT
jgi:hypothetical protein